VTSLNDIYGEIPSTPQEEAEWAAVAPLAERAFEEEPEASDLACMIQLLKYGAKAITHAIGGCTPQSHTRAYEMVVDGVQYLHQLGVSEEVFDRAEALLSTLEEARRHAG
jgi:thiamine monophosphate synthase